MSIDVVLSTRSLRSGDTCMIRAVSRLRLNSVLTTHVNGHGSTTGSRRWPIVTTIYQNSNNNI